MLISCPNCATNFSVPDHALGPNGRTLKCAKCGHKWHQDAPRPEDDFGLDASSFPPPMPSRPEPRMDDDFQPVSSPSDLDMDSDRREPSFTRSSDMDLDDTPDLDAPPVPDFGPGVRSNDVQGEVDLDSPAQPIPDMFATAPKKGGTGSLWLVLLLMLLGGAAGGAYYFQDKVVEIWPPAHAIFTELGLRHEKPGAGLELRNAGTPERFVHNDTEVLIVRGIIANVSDRERSVPSMKLVLLDKDKNVVQEKSAQPPVTALKPADTASFRIILERPDPNAVEVNVMFVDPNEAP